MPNRDTWFKCDPTAFLDGIETLTSDREVALYVVIVMKIYAVGGPISNNPATLAAQSHIDPRWAKRTIDALVKAGKLTITDDGKLSNPRADAELSRRRSLSDTRSKAGKSGGRPPKSKGPTGPDDGGVSRVSEASVTDLSGECPPNVPPLGFAETAENRQSEKPIAFTRAREREKIREENPLTPFSGGTLGHDFRMEPLTPDDRRQMIERIGSAVQRDPLPESVDVAALTGWIMAEARMAVPPPDLVLVESWIRAGMDPELDIKPVIVRMAGSSKSPVRAIRYFDAEMRRVFNARSSASDATIAQFERLARKTAH